MTDGGKSLRRTVLYAGTVQGVGFRYTVERVARRFPVRGDPANPRASSSPRVSPATQTRKPSRRRAATTRGPLPSMLAIYVTVFSIAGKIALTVQQFRTGRRHNSSMLIANGKNMRNDIAISATVLLGLVFTQVLHLSILDAVTALAVSLWIMKAAFEIFLETNTELMDGMSDPSVYDRVFDAVESVEGACNPHRARVRKMSHLYAVDLDVEMDGSLSLHEAHEIAQRVEQAIRERIPEVYDTMIHAEPLGNYEKHERYGLAARRTDHCSAKKQGNTTEPL